LLPLEDPSFAKTYLAGGQGYGEATPSFIAICGRNYLADGIIWRTELFGGRNYLADGIIWRTELFGGRNYLADGICVT
jgi:hypothetical protein